MKGYQVGLWIGFAVTILCVLITLTFVPSKATLEKKRLLRAEAVNGKVAVDDDEAEKGGDLSTTDIGKVENSKAANDEKKGQIASSTLSSSTPSLSG